MTSNLGGVSQEVQGDDNSTNDFDDIANSLFTEIVLCSLTPVGLHRLGSPTLLIPVFKTSRISLWTTTYSLF